MDKTKLKNQIVAILKDLFLALVIVIAVMLILFAYCGVWPPMVVVESGSMQHSDSRSYVGVIDTGDMVFVKHIHDRSDIVSYVEGEAWDYQTYGAFGDVVIYRPNGDENRVPIIHRLVMWLEINTSRIMPPVFGYDYVNYSFNIPSLGICGSLENVTLQNYGYEREEVTIRLSEIMEYYQYMGIEPHSGYITMGDHNAPHYDQPLTGSYEPVMPEWIIGKAIGELPWFGLIKLALTGGLTNPVPRNSWVNLTIVIVSLVSIPFVLDFVLPYIRKRRNKVKQRTDITTTQEKMINTKELDNSASKSTNSASKDIDSNVPLVQQGKNNKNKIT